MRQIKIDKKIKNNLTKWLGIALVVLFFIVVFEVYIPKSLGSAKPVIYTAEKGGGTSEIASQLEKKGIIKSKLFFTWYVFLTGNYAKLQAGTYDLFPSMSIAGIAQKFVEGEVVKNKMTIIEGWDVKDIAIYVDAKSYYTKTGFLAAEKADFTGQFDFLKNKPKGSDLEGYLFPDTYLVPVGTSPENFVRMMLNNFNQKLTPDLRKEITKQKKTIFQIVTMASILEKEVRTTQDKKIVAGILWKRMANNVPLQLDATVNYITDKNDPSVSLKDLKIDSPYNTYKYRGLPFGPISNPGLDSIMAAIYPTKSDDWFYLSDPKTGKTIFSSTLAQHNLSIGKYLSR